MMNTVMYLWMDLCIDVIADLWVEGMRVYLYVYAYHDAYVNIYVYHDANVDGSMHICDCRYKVGWRA